LPLRLSFRKTALPGGMTIRSRMNIASWFQDRLPSIPKPASRTRRGSNGRTYMTLRLSGNRPRATKWRATGARKSEIAVVLRSLPSGEEDADDDEVGVATLLQRQQPRKRSPQETMRLLRPLPWKWTPVPLQRWLR